MRKLKVLLAALALLGAVTGTASATCYVGGTVTSATRYNPGTGYWIAVHYDNGTWASFRSLRPFRVGERTYTYGPCADATRYSQPWLAWRLQ